MCVMRSTSDNIKFTFYNHANQVINELFESLCSKYQDKLETFTACKKGFSSHEN